MAAAARLPQALHGWAALNSFPMCEGPAHTCPHVHFFPPPRVAAVLPRRVLGPQRNLGWVALRPEPDGRSPLFPQPQGRLVGGKRQVWSTVAEGSTRRREAGCQQQDQPGSRGGAVL